MTETLANGYSSESTQRELSNEYQHDRILMDIRNLCVIVLLTKVASALEGLSRFIGVFDELFTVMLCGPVLTTGVK